jgi:hypothetical protein
VFQSKRAAFDSKAHAVPDEAKALASKSTKGGGRGGKRGVVVVDTPAPVKTDWESKSNQLREAMKASRAYSKAVATGAPLPPMASSGPDPSLVPCSNCGRYFSATAAERHIPKCASIKSKVGGCDFLLA